MTSIVSRGPECQGAARPAKAGPAAAITGIHSLVGRSLALVLRALHRSLRRLAGAGGRGASRSCHGHASSRFCHVRGTSRLHSLYDSGGRIGTRTFHNSRAGNAGRRCNSRSYNGRAGKPRSGGAGPFRDASSYVASFGGRGVRFQRPERQLRRLTRRTRTQAEI